MKRSEAARLLTFAAAFDNRKIDEEDDAAARAWADVLDGLTFEACFEAIRTHYRTETAFIMPAHIRRLASTRVGPSVADIPVCDRCRAIHDFTEPCEVLTPVPKEFRDAVPAVFRRVEPSEVSS
jgi:hypothetical protein